MLAPIQISDRFRRRKRLHILNSSNHATIIYINLSCTYDIFTRFYHVEKYAGMLHGCCSVSNFLRICATYPTKITKNKVTSYTPPSITKNLKRRPQKPDPLLVRQQICSSLLLWPLPPSSKPINII